MPTFAAAGPVFQPAISAVAWMTAIMRESCRLSSRNCTGSAPSECASSSTIDSFANVFWMRAGERSGPARNDLRTVWFVRRAAGMM